MEDFGKKLKKLSEKYDGDKLKNASDEELLEYLFLVEKLKIKLEELVNLEDK